MSQFYIFLICILIGAAGGLLYDAVALLRAPFSARPVRWISDGLFCILFAAVFLLVSVALELPSVRFYMFLGLLAGFALYLKSLHKIVAFFAKKIYNGMKQIRRGRNRCPEKEAQVSPMKK